MKRIASLSVEKFGALRDERGAIAIIFGLALMLFVCLLGSGVDLGRQHVAQGKLQSALDSAGLATGASGVTDTEASHAMLDRYLAANFPHEYLGTNNLHTTLTAVSDTDVVASVTATVPTAFMKVAGINTMNISAQTHVTRRYNLEVALVLDNTGSMRNLVGGVSKFTWVKNSAKGLVGLLHGSRDMNNPTSNSAQESLAGLYIGVVPFAEAVNVDQHNTSWISNQPNDWNGCVRARQTYSYDNNTPYGVGYYYANPWRILNDPYDNHIEDTDINDTSPSGMPFLGFNDNGANGVNCPQPLTPLTMSETKVLNAIDAMTAQGPTTIQIGLAWGFRELSPNWRQAWKNWRGTFGQNMGQGGGQRAQDMINNNLPSDFNTPGDHKVVILLTDGDNYVDWRGDGGPYHNYYSFAPNLGLDPVFMTRKVKMQKTDGNSSSWRSYIQTFITTPLETLSTRVDTIGMYCSVPGYLCPSSNGTAGRLLSCTTKTNCTSTDDGFTVSRPCSCAADLNAGTCWGDCNATFSAGTAGSGQLHPMYFDRVGISSPSPTTLTPATNNPGTGFAGAHPTDFARDPLSVYPNYDNGDGADGYADNCDGYAGDVGGQGWGSDGIWHDFWNPRPPAFRNLDCQSQRTWFVPQSLDAGNSPPPYGDGENPPLHFTGCVFYGDYYSIGSTGFSRVFGNDHPEALRDALPVQTVMANYSDHTPYPFYAPCYDFSSSRTDYNTQKGQMDKKTLQACNDMKSHGIQVYVIALGTSDAPISPSGKAVLQACATQPSTPYYFDLNNPADLSATFVAIAEHLKRLRVSQ